MLSSLQSYHKDKRVHYDVWCKWLAMLCLVLFTKTAAAQNSEIGFEIGGYNYLGDVTRNYEIGNYAPGAQFFVRRHVDQALSLRWSLGVGSLKGADDEAFDVFSANRRASFKGNFMNADLLFEYHFLDYRDEKNQQYWTPYILFGLGVYRFEGEDNFGESYDSSVNLRFPVGIGIKYQLNKRWTLGVSTSAIKSNSDLLDNVSVNNPNIKDYRGGNPNNDDWMFFTGFSLSYTFYKIVCFKPWSN